VSSPQSSPRSSSRSPDILVVGAGIIGCAVAFELAERGASVSVIDDRPIGMGATRASAGVLAPYIEARDGGPLVDLTKRSLDLYDGFVARLSAAARPQVRYHRTGTLDVALTEAALARLADAADQLATQGVDARLLSANAVRVEVPHVTANALGGLSIPVHGFVSAAGLTRALADEATRHGVRIEQGCRIGRIASTGDDVSVETDRGKLAAARVVLAAGAWSAQIEVEGALPAPVRPIRGQLLQLAARGPALPQVMWGERCYLVPWDDGTLLVGATVEDVGFDEGATASGVGGLLEAAQELVPTISQMGFVEARAGLRPATADHLPIIGPSVAVPGLVYATGHYRNGILLAPLTAMLAADVILDGGADPLLALTRPARFGL
jgi:glycine oxidase